MQNECFSKSLSFAPHFVCINIMKYGYRLLCRCGIQSLFVWESFIDSIPSRWKIMWFNDWPWMLKHIFCLAFAVLLFIIYCHLLCKALHIRILCPNKSNKILKNSVFCSELSSKYYHNLPTQKTLRAFVFNKLRQFRSICSFHSIQIRFVHHNRVCNFHMNKRKFLKKKRNLWKKLLYFEVSRTVKTVSCYLFTFIRNHLIFKMLKF